MSDEEFDVLDELYFVQHFEQLLDLTGKEASSLKQTLLGLRQKGWIKAMKTVDDEINGQVSESELSECYFLATKEGLMAHNS